MSQGRLQSIAKAETPRSAGGGIVIDGCAGPGGWSEALRQLGIADVGIELDAAACATRRAAGHATVRADVSTFPVAQLVGKVWGQVHSPPCTTFSAAGDQAGNANLTLLGGLIRATFAGHDERAVTAAMMTDRLKAAGWPEGNMPAAKREQKVRTAVATSLLVAEPARFIAASLPEWVTLEQVPSVLPLWRVYADELRRLGYSAWYGKLNAADYGVPQTRERAILIASRVRTVRRPEPTHYDPRKGMQLWGTPWVSMAEALGWGATGRPGPSVTAGGTSTGGAEPFARGGRDALEAERDAGNWVLHTNRDQRPDGSRQTADPRCAPAPAPALTAKSGGQWVFRNNNNDHACARTLDEPAGTLFFGQRSNWAAWVAQPAGTVVDGRSRPPWTRERPSTTVQGDPRIGRPGHKDRDKGEAQFAQDSVRITVQEAAVLQSFPADYPWQGTKTKQFEQVGNAVPPLLAIHVVAMATGLSIAERAA